jgi:N-acetylmuramoyl-L-alanine amidase
MTSFSERLLPVMEPFIVRNHLPYVSRLESREPAAIDLAVIHCTELPDLATARKFGEKIHYADSGTGNSGHYYIEQNGKIEQWVPDDRIAHHVRGFNERSIGIELDNKGRYPLWFDSRQQQMTERYTLPQLNSLVGLLNRLSIQLPSLQWIAGHGYLDTTQVPSTDNPALLVNRKKDPGPQFPWKEIVPLINLELFRH